MNCFYKHTEMHGEASILNPALIVGAENELIKLSSQPEMQVFKNEINVVKNFLERSQLKNVCEVVKKAFSQNRVALSSKLVAIFKKFPFCKAFFIQNGIN